MEKKKAEMTVKDLAAMGGEARAVKLSQKRRREIASQAAKARWAGKKKKEKG